MPTIKDANLAYMMRRDGKLFPCVQHPYGGDLEETLAAAEWLYSHTASADTKAVCEHLVVAYAKSLDPDIGSDEIASTIEYVFKRLPYHVCTLEFINAVAVNFAGQSLDNIPEDPAPLVKTVNDRLNDEFLRVRIGGMYDSDAGNNSTYFRISSTGFNWFALIWTFVYERRHTLTDVTVVKDPEATGTVGYYYKGPHGPYDHIPVDEFITVKGNPMFDSAAMTHIADAAANCTRLGQ